MKLPGKMVPFILLVLSAFAENVTADSHEPSAKRQAELLYVLRHDCGSCHGMTLKGGLGPALTQAALASKPVEYLYSTVRDGRPGTPMPPWQGILNDAEIHWLVNQLMHGVPVP